MPTLEFLGPVTLDLVRTEVPAGHAALRVEQEDRVFLHAFHQQAETLLAAAQRFLLPAMLGEVARGLGKTTQGAVLVADGGDDDVGPEQGAVLALAPAFLLVAALALGDLELVRGPRSEEHTSELP